MLKELPKNWVIKVTLENKPTLQKYTYCNKEIGYPYTINGYYGNKSHGDYHVNNNEVEITFEEFKKFVLKQFPEKWCIKVINQEIADYCTKNGVSTYYSINPSAYAHFPSVNGSVTKLTTTSSVREGYIEISFEEFEKHILRKSYFKNEDYRYLIPLLTKLDIK